MSQRVLYAPPRPRRRLGALLVVVALVASSGPVGAEEPARVPARPTGLEVTTEAGSLDVGLDWDDVDGAASYLVRWRLAGAGNSLNEGHEAEDSETTVTVESPGDWVVRIEACNDAGCGRHLAERFTVEPGPAVDEEAERYESFTGEHTAPRGILVSKFFDGIFTHPDGDELAYSAEVTGGRVELVGELEVRFNERARPGYQHILWFEADDDSDWTALSPPVPNPVTFEVTLTATDPDGESASVTGVFSTRWEPPSFSAESVPVPEPEAASEPETAPATDSDAASDALAVAVAADRTILVEGERVTLTAAVANAPSGAEPAYRWEMNDGGWFTVGRRAEFSYLTKTTGSWDFRVTVTYPSGETATSEPLTVAWATRAAPDARADARFDAQGFVQGQQSTDTSFISTLGTGGTTPTGRAAGTYTIEVVTRDPGPGPTGLGFYLWAAVIVPHDFSGLDASCRTYISTGVSVARAVSDHPSGVCESVSAPGRAAHYLVYEGNPTEIGPLQMSSTDGITMDLNLWADGLIVASDSTNRKGYARIGSHTGGGQYVVEVAAHFRRQTGRFHLTDGNAARPECGRTLLVEPGNRPSKGYRWNPETQTHDEYETTIYDLRFGASASDPWGQPCNSVSRPGSYSRYYTFTLTRAWHMRFDTAAYGRLYLRQGTAGSGAYIAESHDPRQRPFNARIDHILAAGTYTLEAQSEPGRGGTTALRIGGHRVDAPDAPTAVAAAPVGFDRIDVTWRLPVPTQPPSLEFGVAQGPPSKPRTAVVVTWHPQGNTAAANTVVLPADATSHSITGLTGGTYRVTVAARNPAGDTAAANRPLVALAALDPPAAADNVVAQSAAGHDRIPVTWALPAPTASRPRTAVKVSWNPASPDGTNSVTLGANALSYTITGLAENTTYTVTVNTINQSQDSADRSATATTTDVEAPDPVTGITAMPTGDTITVSWTLPAVDATKPVTSVELFWTPTGGTTQKAVLAADATSHTITGLTGSTDYALAINTVGPGGRTAATATATTLANPLAVWFSGDTPRVRRGTTSFAGHSNIRIYMRSSTNKPAVSTCVIPGADNLNCPPGTLVSIGAFGQSSGQVVRCLALIFDCTSSTSGGHTTYTLNRPKYKAELTISATAQRTVGGVVTETAATEFKFFTDLGGPIAPQVAVSAGSGKISVGWSEPESLGLKPGNVLSGFQVWHRQEGATTWNKSSWLAATAREYEITGLTDGTTYQVRVRARAQSNNHAGTLTQYEGMTTGTCTSNYRTMCNATPTSGNAAPGTPQNPAAAAVPGTSGAGKVTVSWTAPAVVAGSTGTYHRYRIDYYHTGNKTGTLQTAYVDGRTTSTTLEGLTSGTGYSFEIRAEGGGGDSAYTTAVTATPN